VSKNDGRSKPDINCITLFSAKNGIFVDREKMKNYQWQEILFVYLKKSIYLR
jgi:hypothetical protein